MKFRKKPVFVTAEQLTAERVEAHVFDKAPLPFGVHVSRSSYHRESRTIGHTSLSLALNDRDSMVCAVGDWIITHADDRREAVKPDVFAATYEAVIP